MLRSLRGLQFQKTFHIRVCEMIGYRFNICNRSGTLYLKALIEIHRTINIILKNSRF